MEIAYVLPWTDDQFLEAFYQGLLKLFERLYSVLTGLNKRMRCWIWAAFANVDETCTSSYAETERAWDVVAKLEGSISNIKNALDITLEHHTAQDEESHPSDLSPSIEMTNEGRFLNRIDWKGWSVHSRTTNMKQPSTSNAFNVIIWSAIPPTPSQFRRFFQGTVLYLAPDCRNAIDTYVQLSCNW
jgi:hypothetical protein